MFSKNRILIKLYQTIANCNNLKHKVFRIILRCRYFIKNKNNNIIIYLSENKIQSRFPQDNIFVPRLVLYLTFHHKNHLTRK